MPIYQMGFEAIRLDQKPFLEYDADRKCIQVYGKGACMSETSPPNARDEDYEPDLLTLEDEAGQEHVFEVIDAADIDGERYLAVAPYSEEPAGVLDAEAATLLFMRAVQEGDEDEYLDIVEDDEELSVVMDVFYNRLSEIYEIDLDDLQQ